MQKYLKEANAKDIDKFRREWIISVLQLIFSTSVMFSIFKIVNDSADMWHDKIKSHFLNVQKNTIRQDLMCSVQKLNATKIASPLICAFNKTIKIAQFDRL